MASKLLLATAGVLFAGGLGLVVAGPRLAPREPVAQPLYTRRDVEAAMRRVQPLPYDQRSTILPGIDLVLRHIPDVKDPLAARHDHYALVELASPRPDADLRGVIETVLAGAMEEGLVLDAVIAESMAQRQAMWRIREEHAEAQKREGASIKNDVSVPVSCVPDLIARGSNLVRSCTIRLCAKRV